MELNMKLIKTNTESESLINKSIASEFKGKTKDIRYIIINKNILFTFNIKDGYSLKVAKIIISKLQIFKDSESNLILSINNNNISALYLDFSTLDISIVIQDIEYSFGALLSIYENYKKNNTAFFYIDIDILNEGIISLSEMLEISDSFFHKITNLKELEHFEFKKVKESNFSKEGLKKNIDKILEILRKRYIKKTKHIKLIFISIISLIFIGATGLYIYNYIEAEKAAEQKRLLIEARNKALKNMKLNKEETLLKTLLINNKLSKSIIKKIREDNNINSLNINKKEVQIISSSKRKNFSNSKTIKKIGEDIYIENISLDSFIDIPKNYKKAIKSFKHKIKRYKLEDFFKEDNPNIKYINSIIANKSVSIRTYNSKKEFIEDLILLENLSDYKFSLSAYITFDKIEVIYNFYN